MSEKEKIIALLDDVPEYKIGYILAYVQGITAEEKDTKESESAYQQLLQMKRKAPDDFKNSVIKVISPQEFVGIL